MPYYITNENPDCNGWAVEKDDGEVIGCHRTRQEAIDQMVAVSIEEDIEPGGERAAGAKNNLPTNARMRRAAAEGLRLREEYGRGGTSVGAGTARRIVDNRVDLDLAVKMRAYFARHEVDRAAPGFRRGSEEWPSNGFIAWQLWGGDAGWDWAKRQVAAAERRGERGTDPTEKEHANMQVKTFAADIKVAPAAKNDTGPGEFTAVVSVFENTDLAGDRVKRGAFADSLRSYQEKGRSIPIVWNHDWGSAESFIGKAVTAEETDEGLVVRGTFFDTPRAQQVRTLLAERVVSEFSFAYDILDEEKSVDGVNELRKLHILEAGPTLKGANPATRLIEAKTDATLAEAPASVTGPDRMLEQLAEAAEILDQMTSRIRTAAEPVKAEEPEPPANAEEQGMDAAVALALVELSDTDN